MPRQIALDTETTGLKPGDGHRIIEIGAVEIVDGHLTGQTFHTYLNPHRSVPADAIAIHGITAAFLTNKPSFSGVWQQLIQFIDGAELLIYNAPFDLGFLNHELRHIGLLDLRIETYCSGVIDVLAESKRTGNPFRGNKLQEFAQRWGVNAPPGKHGALRDAKLLADAYLAFLVRYSPPTPDSVSVTKASQQHSDIDLLPYLPSYALGVYRLDDELAAFKSKDRLREFGERKIRCLPVPLRAFITQFYDQQAGVGPAWNVPYVQDIPTPANLRQTYSAFFNGTPYFDNWRAPSQPNSAGSENFLEIEFVKNVLARVLNDTALDPRCGKVFPQHQTQGFFVDFLIKGEIDYVIEIDGLAKLESPEAFSAFLHRQNVLQDAGYKIFRFGYAQIMKNWEQAARTLVRAFSKDRVLSLRLRQHPRSILLGNQTAQTAQSCPSDLVDLFYGIQDYFALTILPKCGDSEITVCDNVILPFPWVAMAISSLYQWLDGIRGLFETSFRLPNVKVITNTLLPADGPALHPAISLQPVATGIGNCREIGIDEVWSHLANHRQPPRRFPSLQYRSFRDATLHEVRDAIVPFARSVFDYNDVRSDQDKVFQRVLSGLPTLALMPTGSGKSFCYWLPAILRPGLSIIISPLNALMRDQLHSLQEHGINSAAVINSDLQGREKDALYIDAKAGKFRMLFISPERMRIRKFREELAQIVANVPVNYLVVDEAHCVSEWGHDFRPAYLGISEFASRLREQNPSLSLITLTATAGKNVKEDMMRVLGLREEDVVSAKQFDRANLSYQIIKVSGYRQKQDAYRRALTHDLPTSIGVSSFDEVLAPGEGAKGVGLAFAIYADPHGKHSWQDGVPHYLQFSREVLLGADAVNISKDAYDIGAIRGYSSKLPTFCPKCRSHHYGLIGKNEATDDEVDSIDDIDTDVDVEGENEGDTGQIRYICRNCGTRFSSPGKAGNWDAVRHENQRAFKRGDLDILVTTKGFGMGIDKGSVRFAMHTHMPSGTEGWYQEIGRAGRDRLHSHCISIFDMPTAACIQALEANELRRPSCTMLHGCNQGRNDDWLCDYGKQHAFISASYPGHAQDVARALRVLGDLLAGCIEGSEIVTLQRGRDKAQKVAELALYRLQCIGLVKAYDIAFVHGGVKFDVAGFCPDEWPRQVNDAVASYWQRHGERIVPEEKIQAVSEEACKSYFGQNAQSSGQFKLHEPLFRHVARALAEILDHVYGDILKMRYRMLFNLYEIANSDACLRKGLLTYFHPDPGEIDTAYRCEFCSNCRPDLDFLRERAVDVLYRDDTREAVEKLEVFLESGLIENLDAAFKLAQDLDDSSEHAYGRAARFLEGAPRNLAALFVAMRFAPTELKPIATKEFFRIALAIPGIDQDFLVRCYVSLSQEHRPAILLILNEVGGKFDTMPGWRWLRQEAISLSFTQPTFSRMSTALGIRQLTGELAGLNLEIDARKLNQRVGRI
jgi:ATP-dependent DNA helicase RecQ